MYGEAGQEVYDWIVLLLILRIEAGRVVSVGRLGRMCRGGGCMDRSAPAVRGRSLIGRVRGGAGK